MQTGATCISFLLYNKSSGTLAPTVATSYPTSTADTWSSATGALSATAATLVSGNATTDATWSLWKCAIPANTGYINGAELDINVGSLGTSKYVCFSQVQLELGTSNTTFMALPLAEENIRCNRRYRRINQQGTSSASVITWTGISGYAQNATQANFIIPFLGNGGDANPMATTPAVSVSCSATGDVWAVTYNGGILNTYASSTPSLYSLTFSQLYFNTHDSLVSGGYMILGLYHSGGGAWIDFSSDL